MIMRQQDEDLDEVANAVGVLKTMGNVISNELDEQAVCVEAARERGEQYFVKERELIEKEKLGKVIK